LKDVDGGGLASVEVIPGKAGQTAPPVHVDAADPEHARPRGAQQY
jgi:hypothetical protein